MMLVADSHMKILRVLYTNRGTPIRGKRIAEEAGVPQGWIYEHLKRVKKKGWLIVTMHTPKERITGVPFYSISPLGIMAGKYGEAERLEAET